MRAVKTKKIPESAEEMYRLTLFVMIRNNIMAQPVPGDRKRLMMEKYDKEYINRVARKTLENAVEMVDFEGARKSWDEANG